MASGVALFSYLSLFLIPLQKTIGFQINQVTLHGNVHTSRAEILQLLNPLFGQAVTQINSSKTAQELQTLAWVESASVKVELPHTLVIRIQEYPYLALYQNRNQLTVINSRGELLPQVPIDHEPGLLILSGEQAYTQLTSLTALLTSYPPLKERVVAATWVSQRRWNFLLDNQILIKLPQETDQILTALDYILLADQQHNLFKIAGAVIDMRVPDRMALNPGPLTPLSPPQRPKPSQDFFVNTPPQSPTDALVGGDVTQDRSQFAQ